MSEEQLPFGTMKENDGLIIVDIPLSDTNIADTEQLEELKRDDPFFFSCQHYIEEAGSIHIYYKRHADYQPLKAVELNDEKKNQIAKQILEAERIHGTQYTTSFNPENIYVNNEGAIKFAHRGIRSIVPPTALSGAEFLQEVKRFLIYLYTDQPFLDINAESVLGHDQAFINEIAQAGSVGELKNVIEGHPASDGVGVEPEVGEHYVAPDLGPYTEPDIPNQTPPLGLGQEESSPVSHDPMPLGSGPNQEDLQTQAPVQPNDGLADNQQQTTPQPNQQEKQKKEKDPNKKTNPLVIGLFGFVCGLLVLYLFQVMPLDKDKEKLEASYSQASSEAESLEEDYDSLEDDNKDLKDEIATHERIEEAYKLALQDEKDEAIAVLEEIGPVNDGVKDTLVTWYIDVGSVDSLQKALQLGSEHDGEIAEKLAKLDDDVAEDVIVNMDPSDPSVMVEQAWLDDAYDDVISIFEDELEDNSRAKYLAAKSYIELEEPEEARELGESLNNKSVQISALEKEKDLIDDDDDMDKDDRKDEKKKIDKKIKKLKK